MSKVLLRRFIAEAVAASATYMKKEEVKQRLQELIQGAVKRGEVQTNAQLNDWWRSLEADMLQLKRFSYDELAGDDSIIDKVVSDWRVSDLLRNAIGSGVASQLDLSEWWDTMGMAARALKGVQLEGWQRLSGLAPRS